MPQPAASPSPSLSAAPTAAPTPTARPPDWDALARALRGPLVRPADAGYDAARVLYNTRFDAIRPQGIARCNAPSDVRECVAFAAQTGVPIAVRSGGHSYAGWSTGPGLVVDTGPLRTVDIRDDLLTAGAGARLIDVYARAATDGFGIPGGSCATVGIAGLTLGGGVGVLSRAWGLTCDGLLAAQIVTADGRILTCDEQHEPDLFWALHGGGASFGVVTSLTFRARPARPLALASLSWDWGDAAAVVAGWQEWQRQAPETLWSNLHLDVGAGGTPTLTLYGVFADDVGSLGQHLDRLDRMVGVRAARSIGTRSFIDTMLVDAGCLGRTISQCHLKGDTPDAQLDRDTYAAKSIVATSPLSQPAVAALVGGIATPPAGTTASVIYDALGGAVARVAPEASPFPHRTAIGILQLVITWSAAETEPAALAWLRSFHASVRGQSGTPAYANYADPDLADWQQAYYGANYARLQRVKRIYDPGELFRFPQSIRP